MLISERVDFTGAVEDVTDRAEGMPSDELKQYRGKVAIKEITTRQ